ncbi:MAG: hypothetical protein IJZ17_01630 [Muribaculaceae bacterium]|nr:hypothetical protein [Muribaculaceae bacterium]
MKVLFILILTAMSVSLACCRNEQRQTHDDIHSGYELIQRKDVDGARRVCDKILYEQSSLDDKDCATLCQLSLLYMHIADYSGNGEDEALATTCFREAFQADSAFAAEFYANLSTDEAAYGMLLASIARGLDHEEDIAADSLSVDTLSVK